MCLKHTEMSWNRLFQYFSIQTCTEKAYFTRFQYVSGKCTFPDEGSSARQSRGRTPDVDMDKGNQDLSPELKRKVRFWEHGGDECTYHSVKALCYTILLRFVAHSASEKLQCVWNILKPAKIGFFSAYLNTEILKKSVSGHFSAFQTHCNFSDMCLLTIPWSA